MLPSTLGGKVTYNKIDDMTKLIKYLIEKISRLEMENQNQNRPIQENDN